MKVLLRLRSWALVLALALGITGRAHASEPVSADSLRAAPTTTAKTRAFEANPVRAQSSHPLFARRDLWLGLAAVGGLAAVSAQDQWLTEESTEAHSSGERALADFVRPLGSGALVYSALAAGYGLTRLTGHPEAASQFMRVGLSVAVAGVTTVALKEIVGRTRPEDAPGDSDELHPFSGHDSFPSGHTTVAFALASAIDSETEARWVPWVAYPAAALVGWSRIHDNRHWASDVFAGAVLGASVAAKADRVLRDRAHAGALGFELRTWGSSPELALTLHH